MFTQITNYRRTPALLYLLQMACLPLALSSVPVALLCLDNVEILLTRTDTNYTKLTIVYIT